MDASFDYIKGKQPLMISMPHNSSIIPVELESRLTKDGKNAADTDWFIDRLYDFAQLLGVHIIKPTWSRLYIDLNRDPEGVELYPGSNSTELCPTTEFSGKPVYLPGKEPNPSEISQRLEIAWRPYHQCIKETLTKMVSEHGYAILFDAHSIRSRVPRFFDGQLPDFNFGNNSGKSCDRVLIDKLEGLNYKNWTQVTNGRFKGGYITRHYGNPAQNIHSIQLELSQSTYMDEEYMRWDESKAEQLKRQLQSIVQTLIDNPFLTTSRQGL